MSAASVFSSCILSAGRCKQCWYICMIVRGHACAPQSAQPHAPGAHPRPEVDFPYIRHFARRSRHGEEAAAHGAARDQRGRARHAARRRVLIRYSGGSRRRRSSSCVERARDGEERRRAGGEAQYMPHSVNTGSLRPVGACWWVCARSAAGRRFTNCAQQILVAGRDTPPLRVLLASSAARWRLRGVLCVSSPPNDAPTDLSA